MATILSGFLGGKMMMGLWYHFAILFEALFILTTVDAGTRVCRFMIQDLVGNVVPSFKDTKNWASNLIGSAVACTLWGYFLYTGVIDPLGGIWTMWPLFGTSNQMLAAIALTLCTVVLFKMKQQRYAWVTIIPTFWLVCCTLVAGYEKAFSADTKVGFLSHAAKYSKALEGGQVLAPAKDVGQMQQIIFNDYVDATLAIIFAAVVLTMVLFGLATIRRALASHRSSVHEVGPGALPGGSSV
jgi:carbon starvation protein